MVSEEIGAQTRQTLENLRAILTHAGASFANVVNMRVCLRNTADFPAFNEAFTEVMAGRCCNCTRIGDAAPTCNVEIDRIAVVD